MRPAPCTACSPTTHTTRAAPRASPPAAPHAPAPPSLRRCPPAAQPPGSLQPCHAAARRPEDSAAHPFGSSPVRQLTRSAAHSFGSSPVRQLFGSSPVRQLTRSAAQMTSHGRYRGAYLINTDKMWAGFILMVWHAPARKRIRSPPNPPGRVVSVSSAFSLTPHPPPIAAALFLANGQARRSPSSCNRSTDSDFQIPHLRLADRRSQSPQASRQAS